MLRFANELTALGHVVRVISTGPGVRPRWIDLHAELVLPPHGAAAALRAGAHLAVEAVRVRVGRADGSATNAAAARLGSALALGGSSQALRRGAEYEWVRSLDLDADVTLASGPGGLVPAYLYGRTRPVLLAQNFDTWFAEGTDDETLFTAEAQLCHRLPVDRVCHAGWVERLLRIESPYPVDRVRLAIDRAVFEPPTAAPVGPPHVITPGGRGLRWKGFATALAAMALVRAEVPDVRWSVFGGCDASPDNAPAPFTNLGFLTPRELSEAYQASHVALCPSWFESWPIPPAEAMACGAAVVGTPCGVPDLGVSGQNCLLVPPDDAAGLARAVLALVADDQLRSKLRRAGVQTVSTSSWAEAASHLLTTLIAILDRPAPARGGPVPTNVDAALALGMLG